MAIVIRGKSKCSICQKIIEENDAIVSFANFVPNELDPLWLFNDAGFHETCFQSHPLAKQAKARYAEYREVFEVKGHNCDLCHQRITRPDDYFSFGHLTDNESDPLHPFNYCQFHRRCLKNWDDLSYVYQQLKILKESGTWRGKALEWLISEIDIEDL